MGRPWSHLSCFWPFWLPLAWPRRRRRPKRSLRGRFWEPSWLQQRLFVYDLLGSPRGVFFITFSKLFLQHNCSENNCQRLLRARSAEHGNTVKHNSFSRFFEVSRTAGRTASKPTEEENGVKNNHQQATKISSKLDFSAFQIRAPNIPPKWCPGASPGASGDGPKAAQDGPKRPEYKSYPREGTSYPRERTSYPWENAPGGPPQADLAPKTPQRAPEVHLGPPGGAKFNPRGGGEI